jgi:hypothetical protein
MRRELLSLTGAVLCFVLLLSGTCRSGTVVEQMSGDREGTLSKVVVSVREGQMRTDHEGSGMSTIMDFRADRFVMIDHPSRSYVEVRFSDWEREVTQELLKSAPGRGSRGKKITVRRTGEKALINGFATEKVEVLADRDVIEEDWVTRDLDMREVEWILEKTGQAFSKGFAGEMKEGQEIYKKLRPHGYSILVKDLSAAYGLPLTILEVKKIVKKDLGDELFSPQEGYRRIVPETPKKKP